MKYRGFTSWVKQTVASNVYLYTMWFYGIRKYRGDVVRLPESNDDFYFDGYPRSGNTFFAALLKRIFPNKKFADHLHVVSGIKIALKQNIPIFILIREPKDAVTSNLYRKLIENKENSPDHIIIERLLVSYYNYYSFVKDNIDKVNILKFESCISSELSVIYQIADVAGFEVAPRSRLEDTLNDFQAYMKRKEEEKDSHASSLPNEKRKKFKKEYLHKIHHSPSYNMTKELYNELADYDLLLNSKSVQD